jgi:hypothetical protein
VANSFASALCFFRVSASAFSVSFRGKNVFSASVFFSEIPCHSVANSFA